MNRKTMVGIGLLAAIVLGVILKIAYATTYAAAIESYFVVGYG